jgi:heterogeneous nuclear ribonucleoprotein U-like protein 1
MAMVDFESRPPKMSFAVNGAWLGVASPLHGYKVGSQEHALFPHILSKNCR